MRASFLIAGLCFLLSGLLEDAAQAQSERPSAGLVRDISGPVSERSVDRLAEGERIGVIIMLRDDPHQRALRESGDVRGAAARASFEDRMREVIRDVRSREGQLRASAGTLAELSQPYARFPLSAGFALRATAEEIGRFASHPEVERVFEDALSAPQLDQSTHRIGAGSAWAQGFEGQGSTVAVLDTGVDAFHVMFQDVIKASACFSSSVEGES